MLFSDDSRFVSFAITQRKPRVRVIVPESERRRSGRERVAINYAEKYGLDDEEDVAAARRRGAAASGRKKPKLAQLTDGDFARRRFSVGARVYDSELGVTCHWCRQKTVETHVFCTAEACGKGRRAPLAFCGMCLRNRHGEDVDAAVASGIWECPRCRGSCGDGCVTCCNCGPCRKAHGLAPTHQVIQLARGAGFDNVHDYLVHGATGLTRRRCSRARGSTGGSGSPRGSPPAPATTRERSRGAATPRRRPRGEAREPYEPCGGRRRRLRGRRAAALAEKDAAEDAGVRAATPPPAKGLVPARKRPWAAAIGAMAETTMSSMPTSRPASPATPEADAARARASLARAAPAAPFEGALPRRARRVRVAWEGARGRLASGRHPRDVRGARGRARRARAAGAA